MKGKGKVMKQKNYARPLYLVHSSTEVLRPTGITLRGGSLNALSTDSEVGHTVR